MSSSQEMTFKRFGRSYHLKIETADELAGVPDLNEAHWVATGAPIETISCDATFLDLVDIDHNGRILCFELRQAIRWLFDVLKDIGAVTEQAQQLHVKTLNTESADGRNIAESARKMLRQLGRDESEAITLDEVRRFKQEVEETPVSEAGVVLPEAAEDVEVKAFISDVVSALGGSVHPSGQPGVTRELLETFLSQVQACLDWRARGELPTGQTRTDILPLGTDTTEAYAAVVRLRDKVDQYFAQCRAVALDGRLAGRLSPTADELDKLELSDPAVIDEVMRDSALAGNLPPGTSLASLREKGWVKPERLTRVMAGVTGSEISADGPFVAYRDHVENGVPFPTLTGRAQFLIDHPWFFEADEHIPCHKAPPAAGGDYPLQVTGGHPRWSIHATNTTTGIMLETTRGHPVLHLNPDDASARGIEDEDMVRVFNDVGEHKVAAKISPAVRPGQVILYASWEPYLFPEWKDGTFVEPGVAKWLHFAGGYGHLGYSALQWQPVQSDRVFRVEAEKA